MSIVLGSMGHHGLTLSRKDGTMSEKAKKDVWVRVKDNAGNEFICPIDALKDRETATAEELDECVDNAVTERYSGHLNT